jgi:hypothetical protein
MNYINVLRRKICHFSLAISCSQIWTTSMMNQTRKLAIYGYPLLYIDSRRLDLGYYYWQQPRTNTFVSQCIYYLYSSQGFDFCFDIQRMPMITRVQSKKEVLPGVMRIAPEGFKDTIGHPQQLLWISSIPSKIDSDILTLGLVDRHRSLVTN